MDYPFDGCVLFYSALAAYGMGERLLPFFHDREHVCISKQHRNHSAGKLPEHSKKFIAGHVPNDLATVEREDD